VDAIIFGLIFIIAIFVGALGILAGFAGGVLLVPILVVFFHKPLALVIGSVALSLILPSITATFQAYKKGEVLFLFALVFEIPTSIGAEIGAHLTVKLPELVLYFFFSFLAFTVGVNMLKESLKKAEKQKKEGLFKKINIGPKLKFVKNDIEIEASIFLIIISGFFIGMISGMLGIGGGWLKTPLMVIAFGFPEAMATATAIFMIVITTTVSGLTHFFLGNTSLELVFPLTAGLTSGALIGRKIKNRMNNTQIRKIIGIALIIIGFMMFYEGFLSI